MSSHPKSDSHKPTKTSRLAWLDEKTETPLVDDYGKRLATFLEAIADGKIDNHELKDQEKRLVVLLKDIEPKLDDSLHAEITALLCELTAYNVMKTVHELTAAAKPKTKFRG